MSFIVAEVAKSAAPAVLPSSKYQCNKTLLVIQEATKNDRSVISKKLIEYLLQLLLPEEGVEERQNHPLTAGNTPPPQPEGEEEEKEVPKVQNWCTAREQSAWIITQLHDIFMTHQRWSMMKVHFLLHALLWKSSYVFIEEFHKRLVSGELRFFDFATSTSWHKVPQTNLDGAELPSFFNRNKRPKEGIAAPNHKGGDNSGQGDNKEEWGHANLEAIEELNNRPEDLRRAVHAVWDRTGSSSMYEYYSSDDIRRLQDTEAVIANYIAYLESLVNYRYDYPQVDLLNVVVYDPMVYGIDSSKRKMRISELHGLMTATMELIKSTIANTANTIVSPVSTMVVLFRCINAQILYRTGSQIIAGLINILVHRFLEVVHDADQNGVTSVAGISAGSDMFSPPRPKTVEEYMTLLPHQKLAFLAREWYTIIYQFNRTAEQLRTLSERVQKKIGRTDDGSIWSHVLPQESFNMMKTYGTLRPERQACLWCGSETDRPLCHPEDGHEVPPCVLLLMEAWKQQVRNARALFVQRGLEKATQRMLATLEQSLEDAEKAFTHVNTEESSLDISVTVPSSEFHESSLTGTFVLRRKTTESSFDSSTSSRRDVDMEVMYLNEMMDKTTDSIEALLQDDDVVVVCPDDFSATDKLKLADRFVVLKQRPLGEGTYGKVYRAWDELEGTYLAAKEVPLDSTKDTAAAVHDALHEYTILTQLHDPYVVSVKAFMVTGSVGTIFMEWMPSGSLQDILKNNPRRCLREAAVARFMRDALRGLEYLHSRDIMHRDVKPANMLLGTDGSVKLTDFGNSFVMPEGGHTLENSVITGTAPYMAPECARGTYSRAGDIWSLGCTAVELLSGLVPWCDPVTGARPDMIPLVYRIGSLDDKVHTERPHTLMWARMLENAGAAGLSAELRSFLDDIFVVDRHARPTAAQLLQHPFIMQY